MVCRNRDQGVRLRHLLRLWLLVGFGLWKSEHLRINLKILSCLGLRATTAAIIEVATDSQKD